MIGIKGVGMIAPLVLLANGFSVTGPICGNIYDDEVLARQRTVSDFSAHTYATTTVVHSNAYSAGNNEEMKAAKTRIPVFHILKSLQNF